MEKKHGDVVEAEVSASQILGVPLGQVTIIAVVDQGRIQSITGIHFGPDRDLVGEHKVPMEQKEVHRPPRRLAILGDPLKLLVVVKHPSGMVQ